MRLFPFKLDNFNYVYKMELIGILGIVLLLLYIFYALGIFHKKE